MSEWIIADDAAQSGVVVAVGPAVRDLRLGDEVYGTNINSRPFDLESDDGFVADYAVAPAAQLLRKPAGLSHEEVAGLPTFTVTAIQAIETGLRLMREAGVSGGLENKTVFVPGALSGTGSVIIQVLKRRYGAGRVVASVSTPKLPLVERHLPGLVDQLVDYTAVRRLTDAVPAGSVDFVLNTQWGVTDTFALAKPHTGIIVSITSVPPPGLLRQMLPTLPFWAFWLVGLVQWYYALRLPTGVRYTFISGNPVREDLEAAGELVATGKVRHVGRVVPLEDLEAVRRECQHVYSGKGGFGLLVIKIV